MKADTEASERDRGPLPLADSDWLARCATGKLDLAGLVAGELANRGLDRTGKWVGFGNAVRAPAPAVRREVFERIGRSLGFETLETRNSDRLDFRDVSCQALEKALAEAFEAGKRERVATRRPSRDNGPQR
jgi:hypothetical protein